MSHPTYEGFHYPLTGAFRDSGRALSHEERARFRDAGWTGPLPLLTASEVALVRERLASVAARLDTLAPALYEVEEAWRARPDDVVLHFLGGWKVDEVLHDLVFHPALARAAADALGVDRLRFWHDQVFWKPPHHPGVVPWHQDYAYWTRTGPPAHVTLFLALDDCTAESGGLEVLPGTHRGELLPLAPFGGPRDALLDALPADRRAALSAPELVALRAGEASLHHSHLIHGSGPNRSDRPRRAVVLNYFADGTRVVDGSHPLLAGVEHLAAGEPVRGPHFPLVFARS